ncbi:MAG: hypothetical protein A3E37_02570 [Candidatus Andersenbacteria bacterium RIFCSPHIGHO2_12_FULL_46_9]|nr:MAG: hypothetical protein A3B76_03330 [Candidatus Andersenbacteria bacterium RIFCSPHIGHO2_02_FULL_46_16]OGY37406.1 MAG: hypothetical protein A3E37_02570 [Candidatus Andersenbacteria bacterium RIFCSPHIGHO2_12_FULL_46_9]OGY37452.1 MAG: hypothetical protein A3I08_00245 [Candidatus Andersenbacteria bacterium RIFCSPLOWO2_02_FULL_46_11]OGY39978.1 MAG: hypothetical protein A3G57_04905 [Candidatus Andersenbacteria bacterium RIFCSPLOWO2_12_FULL_45_8]HBE89743.1 hypothetical protein [Candidatus Anderse
MRDTPETAGFASSSWEANEAEPLQKHEIAIDRDVGTTVAERADWLAGVWDVDDYEDGQNQRQMLEDWKSDLPEYKEFIEQFPFSEDIPDIINNTYARGETGHLHKMQDLCKAVLERYGSEKGSEGWNELPEENKQYVRMAEMTILMIDTRKLERDVEAGKGNPKSAVGLINKLQRYRESNDVPQNYKERVIDPALKIFNKEREPEQQKKRPTPQQQKQMEEVLKEMMKRKGQEHEQPANTTRPDAAVDEDVIDTKFNSETGAYEPIGDEYTIPEAAPGEPKRLTYEPNIPSSDTGDGSPSVGPETPSSPAGGGGGMEGGSVGGGMGGGAGG